jgi:hypothetical protein
MLGCRCHDGCPQHILENTRGNNMFKSIWNIATATILLCGGTAVVHAYSSGAGQCIGGMAAVGAPHMTSTAVSGSLQDGDLRVTIRDQLTFSQRDVYLNTDMTIGIFASSPGFRGALIRASSADGVEFTFEPVGDNSQMASVCTDSGVLGVTHTSNALKTEFTGILNAATTGTITLDITVVRSQNSQDGSFYYYTPITVTVVDGEPEIDTGATSAPATTTTVTTPAPAASTEGGRTGSCIGSSDRAYSVCAARLDPQGTLGHTQATVGQQGSHQVGSCYKSERLYYAGIDYGGGVDQYNSLRICARAGAYLCMRK